MDSRLRAGMLLLLTFAPQVYAQELRCTQIFMNASEKRICATPALMELDKQIGELGRRAAMHQDGFKSDQRGFRKALKTCDGDETCLTTSYQNRIAELQAYVGTLPPPTEEELAKLAQAGEKANAKREAQADTREQIAEKLSDQDFTQRQELAAEEVLIAEGPVPEVIASEVASVEAPAADAVAQPEQAAATENTEPGWGSIAFLGALVLGALAMFKAWLNRVVRRCPGCKKWFAGKVIDQDRESYTDYETKTFEDVHRDRNYVVTGRTTKQRQVKVRVEKTTNYFQCIHCNNQWAWSSTSRSS